MLPGLIAAASPRSAEAAPASGHFRTARSVEGSRPANVAGTTRPCGSVAWISSSRRRACSAVTMTPGRQMTPLDEPRDSVWTATACSPALAVVSASSFENVAHSDDMFPTSIVRVTEEEFWDIRHLARSAKKDFNTELTEETQRAQRSGEKGYGLG